MASIPFAVSHALARLSAPNSLLLRHPQLPHQKGSVIHSKRRRFDFSGLSPSPPWPAAVLASSGANVVNSVPPRNGTYTVGDFMTKKEDLHVVKTTTTVDEALEALVEKRITGFPVIDDHWKLDGVGKHPAMELQWPSCVPNLPVVIFGSA